MAMEMEMAPTVKVVLGSIAFVIFWVLAVFPAVPFLPIGRTAGSLLGAMLMVIFGVITPNQAYESIDLPVLGLLFGTMVVSIYLERADMFKYLGKLLSWKSQGPKDLLCRICLISAIASAFFTNDTSCVILTEFVLKIARQHNLPPYPFLMALATSSNIGSAATPIGNPQNLVIAIESKLSFGHFLIGLLPATILGVVANTLMLLGMYWKALTVEKGEEIAMSEVMADEGVISHRFSPARMSRVASFDTIEDHNAGQELASVSRAGSIRTDDGGVVPAKDVASALEAGVKDQHEKEESLAEGESPRTRWKRLLWKTGMYLITAGMLIALLMGLNMSWTAVTAALALIILDFKDGGPSLDKVSYSLLVFFCGMFITVDGLNSTGIPSAMWDFMEPYSRIDSLGGIAVLSIVILVLSNVASNVPTVLLLGARVAASAAAISTTKEKKAWLLLAWVSTVAGNFSLLGSAANLIVCEQARRNVHLRYTLSFWTHLKFGVPSTLIVTAIGLTLIRG